MPSWMYLLFAYSITFGVQNKALFLRGRHRFLDALVKCTYCTGFHSGWMVWVFSRFAERSLPTWDEAVLSVLSWGLTSAVFAYVLDTAVRWCEYRPR